MNNCWFGILPENSIAVTLVTAFCLVLQKFWKFMKLINFILAKYTMSRLSTPWANKYIDIPLKSTFYQTNPPVLRHTQANCRIYIMSLMGFFLANMCLHINPRFLRYSKLMYSWCLQDINTIYLYKYFDIPRIMYNLPRFALAR